MPPTGLQLNAPAAPAPELHRLRRSLYTTPTVIITITGDVECVGYVRE